MKKDKLKSSAETILEELHLENLHRSVTYLNPQADAPTIASHTGTTAKVAWVLAWHAAKKMKGVDINKVVSLALWHDTDETRTTDIARDVRRYVSIDEQKALSEKFQNVEWGKEVINLKIEFEDDENKDVNVLLARDADILYVILTIKKLIDAGVKIHKPEERFEKTSNRLNTEIAKDLAKSLVSTDTRAWWDRMMGYIK